MKSNKSYLHFCHPDGVHGEGDLGLHVPLVLRGVDARPPAPRPALLPVAAAVVGAGDAQLDDAWGAIQLNFIKLLNCVLGETL